MNPLKTLSEFSQALWLDDIQRELITSGGLRRLIDEDGLRGMTSNPAIFKKAIAESSDYDEDIRALTEEGKPVKEIFEALAVKEVPKVGIDIDQATQQLEEDGIEKFCKPFDALLDALEKEMAV